MIKLFDITATDTTLIKQLDNIVDFAIYLQARNINYSIFIV